MTLKTEDEIQEYISHFMQTALLASELYKAFIGAGCPPDLASEMTRDWHWEGISDGRDRDRDD